MSLRKVRVTWSMGVEFDSARMPREPAEIALAAAREAYASLTDMPEVAATVFRVTLDDNSTWEVNLATDSAREVFP